MAEFFQARKSDEPTYHVPSEYPKHMYGGLPVTSDHDVKAALANNQIKTRSVNSRDEEQALLDKGWVINLMDLVKEPALPGAVQRGAGPIVGGIHDAEDFTVLEDTAELVKDDAGNDTDEEVVKVRRRRRNKSE